MSNWPVYNQNEIDAVVEVLKSGRVNYWTGNNGLNFEREFSALVGVEYSIALANGTVALELALRALEIGLNDEVIVTSRTFLASVSSIIAVGARPVFADVDLDSQNITVDTIATVCTSKTKAIICVHLAGWPCDMRSIMNFATANELFVIEDCAQAHGAKINGQSVGSFGHIGCWSFCQDKIMSTGGEGGMVTTSDKQLWERMWSYKDHGKSWEKVFNQHHPSGFRWLHDSFGTNLRMTEIQAAIGRKQILSLPAWNLTRRNNANKIWDASSKCTSLRVPVIPSNINHAAYKCYVFVENGKRDEYMNAINSLGVKCFSGSCSEVYLENAFKGTDFLPSKRLVNAKILGETSLMFLCDPTIHGNEIEITCNAILSVCN